MKWQIKEKKYKNLSNHKKERIIGRAIGLILKSPNLSKFVDDDFINKEELNALLEEVYNFRNSHVMKYPRKLKKRLKLFSADLKNAVTILSCFK